MGVEELELSEAKGLYPPRFVVTIKGSDAVRNSIVEFKFEGATKEIVKEVIFTKGTVCITSYFVGAYMASWGKFEQVARSW